MPENVLGFQVVPPARHIRFGPFELDSRAGELRKHGTRIKIGQQTFQILLMLLRRPGDVILREEIRQKLWPDGAVVEFDHSINAAVQKLRDALGETAGNPRYIETLPRRGYRFIGTVEKSPADPASEPGPGRTLDRLIAGNRLPLEDVLGYAIRIADVLAARHAGTGRPELKPSNIIVTEDGAVKLLGFGLAAPADADSNGRKPDAPGEVFSFGLVLYEMLTGRKGTATPPDELAPVEGVAEGLRALLARCLRKDPAKRPQSMADVKEALEEIREVSERGPAKALPASGQNLLWPAALAILLAMGGAAFWLLHGSRPAPVPLAAVPLTTYPGYQAYPSLSPDGNQVAFSWRGDIYVKLIGSDPPLRLTTDPAEDTNPAWSPDGRSIAFLRLREDKYKVFLTSALGGSERQVAELPANFAHVQREPASLMSTWSPDGRWLVVSAPAASVRGNAMYLVSIETGEKRQLTFPPAGVNGDFKGALSPDGRTLAFSRNDGDLYALSLGADLKPNGEPRRLTFDNVDQRSAPDIAWSADGRDVIFSSSRLGTRGLWRVASSGRGEPQRLAVGEDAHSLAISRQGRRLVYTRAFSDANIWRANLSDPREKPSQFISSTRNELSPQYSPDGRKVAFRSDRTGDYEIWMCDADGSNPERLTFNGGMGRPGWSPDSERIAFTAQGLFTIPVHGGRPQRLTRVQPGQIDAQPSWSPDGEWIYFNSTRSARFQVWKVAANGEKVTQVTRKGGFFPQISPDGKTIYYVSIPADPSTLWKLPADGGEETQILDSVNGVYFAVTQGGIYYISGSELRYFGFATRESKPILTIRNPLPGSRLGGMSVSPDGHWLLYSQIDGAGSELMLVENFR